jgi:hypothetical protein
MICRLPTRASALANGYRNCENGDEISAEKGITFQVRLPQVSNAA